MGLVAGIDGAPGGWIVAEAERENTPRLYRITTLAKIVGRLRRYDAVALDMPVGLPERGVKGGRVCDREARRLLGPKRSSVFSPPALPALDAHDYGEACRLNAATGPDRRRISRQCYGLFPKLREVRDLIGPAEQEVMREVHPELSFMAMNGMVPVVVSKKTDEGGAKRKALLQREGFDAVEEMAGRRRELACAPDDILDALACLWSARRIADRIATVIPDDPPMNEAGLRMEILY